jgi:polygalacturonase
MNGDVSSARNSVLGFLYLTAMIIVIPAMAPAQDLRKVTEPTFPPACRLLRARLTATAGGRTLAWRDESKPDTVRIQNALDHCAPGRAVELVANGGRNAFLTGPLDLRPGITLRIGKGAILFGSRNPRDYDLTPGSCGRLTRRGIGCKPLIYGDHVPNAGVMGSGTLDGRGWADLRGENFSWWDLAHQAKVKKLKQNCPRLIEITHSDNFTLYRINLKNSPNFHVMYRDGDGFTAWGVVINTPRTARNTDGIDPSSATNVTIAHCSIHAGDDDVAIKAGTDGPSSHLTVAHDHFYAGHGMSIGSNTNGGVRHVRVRDLTIDGADNGLRIKSNSSRGGLVHDIVYSDVCIRNTPRPIVMDSHYAFYGKPRNELPVFTGIVLHNVRILGLGRITLDGYDAAHRLGITFDNVTLSAPAQVRIHGDHARIRLGPGPVNFRPSGNDVRLIGRPMKGQPFSCREKFPPPPRSP